MLLNKRFSCCYGAPPNPTPTKAILPKHSRDPDRLNSRRKCGKTFVALIPLWQREKERERDKRSFRNSISTTIVERGGSEQRYINVKLFSLLEKLLAIELRGKTAASVRLCALLWLLPRRSPYSNTFLFALLLLLLIHPKAMFILCCCCSCAAAVVIREVATRENIKWKH